MEIERKFTIKQLPDNLDAYTCRFIEQGYLSTDPVVRVRQDSDDYYLTYKSKGLMSREEYNLPLTKESYDHMIKKADGIIISKKRYEIPLSAPKFDGGHVPPTNWEAVIELDVFEGEIAPLIMAEIEFPDEETANAYIPEEWFLEDVTNDRRYHNSNMSKNGFKM